jgi:hypothetical protein
VTQTPTTMPRSATSSRDRTSTGLDLVQAAAAKLEGSQKTSLARWLDSPGAEDVSPVVDAVSELFSVRGDSTITSPATSCSSTAPSLYARKESLTSNYYLSPTSPQHAVRGSNRAGAPSSSSYLPKQSPTSAELREVGAFARAPPRPQQQTRRPYKYRPMSNWADLWLPQESEPEQEPGPGPGTDKDAASPAHDQLK